MKNIAVASRVKVSADGHGLVSHAGHAGQQPGCDGVELADVTDGEFPQE